VAARSKGSRILLPGRGASHRIPPHRIRLPADMSMRPAPARPTRHQCAIVHIKYMPAIRTDFAMQCGPS
jgi:hypothetical protein